jgi:TetR/AcrR family transcriptional regulator, cholesterol catabolism regulator
MDRKEEIKDRILLVARDCFVSKGFRGIKTDFLAKEAGISKRTLYEYFPSKEKIFEEVVIFSLDEQKKRLDKIIDAMLKSETTNVIKIFRDILELISNTRYAFTKEIFRDIKTFIPRMWETVVRFREEQVKANFSKILIVGKREGWFRPELNDDVLYLMHLFIFQNILEPEILSQLPMTVSDLMQTVYDVFFRGVLTEKGKSEYEE